MIKQLCVISSLLALVTTATPAMALIRLQNPTIFKSVMSPEADAESRVPYTGNIEICVRPFFKDSGIADKQYSIGDGVHLGNCERITMGVPNSEQMVFTTNAPVKVGQGIYDLEIEGYKAEARVVDRVDGLNALKRYSRFKNGASVMYGFVKHGPVTPNPSENEFAWSHVLFDWTLAYSAVSLLIEFLLTQKLEVEFDGSHFDL